MRRIAKIRIGLLLAASAFAASVSAQNYQLHSVYLYSFTRYVQWPEEMNSGDFEIQVLGDSPIIGELEKMALAKKVGDRSIRIRKINSLAEYERCNILFIPGGKSSGFSEVLARVGADPTLVITEYAGLCAKGSSINFVTKEGKLAFEINQSTLTKHKLKVSTELTRLAIII